MEQFPAYYDPERIGTLFYPDLAAIAGQAAQASLPPAEGVRPTVRLMIVDMQVDFCHESGSLYVPGALGDIRRLVEFIFRHAEAITGISCTLDSHLPLQIFHPAWWADSEGNHPPPYTVITHQDVANRRWLPLIMPDYSRSYVRRLEKKARKELMIWPYHVMIGGTGNALDPELWSAVIWHALARRTQPEWLVKGRIPQTEHYSVVQPELPVPDDPEGGRHRSFLKTVEASDFVFFAGEAESHCVLETVKDVVEAFADSPEVLGKIYVLRDCMSPVVHPEIDFGALAEREMAAFAAKGVNFINSTDPLPFLAR